MVKQWAAWLVCLFITTTLYAEMGSIRGKVSDKTTGANLIGAKIYILRNGRVQSEAMTDDKGNFIIQELAANTYDIECRMPGFVSQRYVGIMVKSGTRPLYFKMNYDQAELNPTTKKKSKVELLYTYATLEAKQSQEVTTSTLTAQSQLDIPATGYLISAQEISERGYVCLLDLLRDIPEMEIQDKSNPNTYNIISSRGTQGSGRLLILRDGVRINSMVGTDIVIARNFMIRDAKSVEVIVGPASAVYGPDAFMGVVNIITYKGEEINGGSLWTSYGMYNTTDNAMVVGVGKKDIGLMLSGNYYSSAEPHLYNAYKDEYSWYADQYQPNNTQLQSIDRADTIQLANTSQPYDVSAKAYSFNARLHVKQFEFGAMINHEEHSSATGYRPEFAIADKSTVYATTQRIFYVHHRISGKKWSLLSALKSNYWEISPESELKNLFSNYQAAYKFGNENTVRFNEIFTYQEKRKKMTHSFTANLTGMYAHSIAKTSDLPFQWQRGQSIDEQGQYYIGTDITTYEGYSLKLSQLSPFENRLMLGGAIQYQADFGKKWSLFTGLRLDAFDIEHGGLRTSQNYNDKYVGFAPRMGLVFKPTEHWRFKLFYGRAYLTKTPQKMLEHYGAFSPLYDWNGRVVGLTPGYWHLPATNAETALPEYLSSLEMNAIYTKGDLVVAANGFVNVVRNLYSNETVYNAQFVANPTIIVPVAETVGSEGQGWIAGGTFRIDYRLTDEQKSDWQVRLQAAYSLCTGALTEEDNDRPSTRPAFAAMHTLKASATVQYKNFSMYPTFLYRSSSYNEGLQAADGSYTQPSNPAYFVVNLFAKYRVVSCCNNRLGIDIFTRINNLTNARYYNVSYNNSAYFQATPQDPIRVQMGISVNFNQD